MARFRQGISLVEVLLCMALLALMLLSTSIVLQQVGQNSVSLYTASSRSLQIGSLVDEMYAGMPTFQTIYNDAAIQAGNVTTRQAPYLRKVDAANSSSLRRTVHLYLYKDASDPVNSPMYESTQVLDVDDLFWNLNLAPPVSESLYLNGLVAIGTDSYDGSIHRPGYIAGNYGTGSSTVTQKVTNAGDYFRFYQILREGAAGTPLEFSIDVESGTYLVQLHFAELDTSIDGTTNRRRADIYVGDEDFATLLAGTADKTDYSPYETTGAHNKANIQAFEVTVGANEVINVAIKAAAGGTEQQPRIAGISIHRM